MKICEFYKILNELYPSSLSASWDNDGIMCCDDVEREIKKVLISLDATKAAIKYAADNGFDVILTHHPMNFRGTKAITPNDLVGGRSILALQNHITVISLHTRLDAGEEGVNDFFAKKLDLVNIRPFGTSDCPTLGRIGEVALYSSLAFDYFYPVVKSVLHAPYIQIAGNNRAYRVAVCGGAGGDLVDEAIRLGADTLVTGEMSYNLMEDSAERGINIILAGHYFTEAPILERLSTLASEYTKCEVQIYNSNPVYLY